MCTGPVVQWKSGAPGIISIKILIDITRFHVYLCTYENCYIPEERYPLSNV